MKTKTKTKAQLRAMSKKADQLWLEYKEARRKAEKLYRQYTKASDAVTDGWLKLGK